MTNATYQTGAQSGERICILTEIRDKHRRTSRGGEGGCSPPSYRNFWNFSGKTQMIRAKVLGRKYSKSLSKPDLKATFSGVCLVKTELKSNDLRIQVFHGFGKAIYRLHVYHRNLRDEYYFHQQNQRRPLKQTKTYNLGQNLLRRITKNTYFFALTLTKMLTVAN